MTKNRIAQILTLAVLLAVVGIGLTRKTGGRAPRDPQDAVYAMLDAARAGDVKQYLASYTGPIEAALRQTVSQEYLRNSTAAIKGIAVSDPETMSDTEVKLRVEYIYQDRNEAQMMYLEKVPTGWKIARADSDERVKTLIPYGTPVK